MARGPRYGSNDGSSAPARSSASAQAKKPDSGPSGRHRPAEQLLLERASHAHAVLVHREALVGVGGRERPVGEQVVLVRREHDAPAEHGKEDLLPVLHAIDDGGRLRRRVGSHRRFGVVPADPEGDDAQRGELRVAVEHARERVVEHRTVVAAGAHDDLPVHLDAVVEQRSQPPQARGAAAVAEHGGPHLGVGGVDRDVERAEPLRDDPLEVGLGEAREGGEVPVEEAQPVVVVLLVEAGPEARRQLVDEAELAVVVAGADLVEQGRVHLDAERLPRPLRHVDRQLQATSPDLELEVRVVHQEPPLEHVAGCLAVDGEYLVAHDQPGAGTGRAGHDRDDPG